MDDKTPASIVGWKSWVLLGLAVLAIGLYLIATTVLIAEDGIPYIRRAQQCTSDIGRAFQIPGIGYPFLISVVHSLFYPDSTLAIGWIISAQGTTLGCRFAALLLLYGIARRWIGRRQSFMAMLALAFLPYPARFGSDTMRDWPFLVFLIAGMGSLWVGCRNRRLEWFVIAGCLSGMGYLFRVEGAQVVLLGLIALGVEWFARFTDQSRRRLALAGVFLLAGFYVGGGWQMTLRGKILPDKLRFGRIQTTHEPASERIVARPEPGPVLAAIDPAPRWNSKAFVKTPWVLLRQTAECMSPHMLAIAWIGLVTAWRRMSGRSTARFWIGLWGGFQIVMLIYLYSTYGYMSRRHVLPIVVALCLFLPEGFEYVARCILGTSGVASNPVGFRRMVWILLAAGMAINVPKLASPLREDKRGYRLASRWLAENTPEGTKVLVDDARIAFYADRPYLIRPSKTSVSQRYPYLVSRKSRDAGNPQVRKRGVAEPVYSAPLNSRSQDEVVVYRILRPPFRKPPPQKGP
ncbi:MAG: hypothetical protein GX455_15045 [Phycisphaerae bacterium]|nr:hypothetical protein [Phycisphaerae bacterium]